MEKNRRDSEAMQQRKEQGLGDAPIEEQFHDLMNGLAHGIDKMFNGEATGTDRQVGFVLMAFNFGDGPGRCNYISNADRSDVVILLKEQLARFEGQPDITGTA
jgi:hypothetical protein